MVKSSILISQFKVKNEKIGQSLINLIKSVRRLARDNIPIINTKLANQVRLSTTRDTPTMNATDIVVRDMDNSGNAKLRAFTTKVRSPSWAQMRVTATVMELYKAIVSQITKLCNISFRSKQVNSFRLYNIRFKGFTKSLVSFLLIL